MDPERRIVDDIGGWLPLKVVLPMPRGGVRLLAGPLAPVDVFKVLVGPEFFWDEADGAGAPGTAGSGGLGPVGRSLKQASEGAAASGS